MQHALMFLNLFMLVASRFYVVERFQNETQTWIAISGGA